MSFGLSPKEYLAMVVESWKEFKENPLSIRHLISVCVLANHLPEAVAGEYASNDPAKINNCLDGPSYRHQAATVCPDVALVRDLCDYGKHTVLNRRSVQVQGAGAKEIIVANAAGLAFLGFPIGQRMEKLVVTLRDGTERTADSIVADVVEFWQRKFVSDDL